MTIDSTIPVILTDMELRRYVRRLIELDFPRLHVLSYQELQSNINVQPVALLSLDKRNG